KTEPDWTAVPADTPASVRRLLRRCLEKDPRKRLSAIGDARLELDEPIDPMEPRTFRSGGTPSPDLRVGGSNFARLWPVVAAVVATAGVAAVLWSTAARPAESNALARVSILPPAGTELLPD